MRKKGMKQEGKSLLPAGVTRIGKSAVTYSPRKRKEADRAWIWTNRIYFLGSGGEGRLANIKNLAQNRGAKAPAVQSTLFPIGHRGRRFKKEWRVDREEPPRRIF